MSRIAITPLASERLAEYALPIPCYVCGATNTIKVERCTHCGSPMALAHQVEGSKTESRVVAITGPAGVGKTVFLGMLLDMLSRQPEKYQATARGAFSINLQQTVLGAIARHEFPPPTPPDPQSWDWVHCHVERPGRKRSLELIMPDMAGEAVLDEADHPHRHLAIQPLLAKAAGAMVFVDAVQAQQGKLGQDFAALKLLTYLSDIDHHPKRGWPIRPLALVFTKADQCEECFDDPAAYAKAHVPELWRQCRQRFGKHQFFAVGVVGACAHRRLSHGALSYAPLRIEPHGVLEPFEWMLQSL
jgi:hypothetical protein